MVEGEDENETKIYFTSMSDNLENEQTRYQLNLVRIIQRSDKTYAIHLLEKALD